MSDPNSNDELKVPIIESQPQVTPPQNIQDFDPELPLVIKTLDAAAASPSSKLLLVALKACAYLCILPPFFAFFVCLFCFSIGYLFAFISTTIGFAAMAFILFSLEKILKAIMAAYESK